MDTKYRNKKHRELVEDPKGLQKKFGLQKSELIREGLDALEAADYIGDIPPIIRPHPLISNAKIYSIDVDRKNRILFIPLPGTFDVLRPLETINEIEIVELCVDVHDQKFNAHHY